MGGGSCGGLDDGLEITFEPVHGREPPSRGRRHTSSLKCVLSPELQECMDPLQVYLAVKPVGVTTPFCGAPRGARGGASERRGAQRRGARTFPPRAEGAPHFNYR